MTGCRRGRRSVRSLPCPGTLRPGCDSLGGLFSQRPVDRFHAELLPRDGDQVLPKHAHREQAAAGRHARSDQPGGNAEEYAAVHMPRLTRGMLSACKGGLK